MSKKVINQNTNYDLELINSIGSKFIFDENPINRLKNINAITKEESIDKEKELTKLANEINSIEDCSLKNNAQQLVLGDGDINSQLADELTGIAFPSFGAAKGALASFYFFPFTRYYSGCCELGRGDGLIMETG